MQNSDHSKLRIYCMFLGSLMEVWRTYWKFYKDCLKDYWILWNEARHSAIVKPEQLP